MKKDISVYESLVKAKENIDCFLQHTEEATKELLTRCYLEVAVDHLDNAAKKLEEEKSNEQWLHDIGNPFEPIKIKSALESEMMKYNYRKANNPGAISVLDYTIIAVLSRALEISICQSEVQDGAK
jgi:L-lactate utilization protein LutC